MRNVLCYLMAFHCNPITFSLRIPSFIVAFLRVRRLIVHNASKQFRHLCISSSATKRAGGYKPLAKSLKNFNQNYKCLYLFWVGPESKRGWVIHKFAIRKSSLITSHALVHLLQSTIVSNSFYCVKCIHYKLAILPTSHDFWLMFANQLSADHFGTWLIAKLFYSVHKKLRTSGADFKYYEVADLRLRTSRITKLQTCGCGLQKLRSCGLAVADSRILKRLCGLVVADYALKRPIADLRLRIKKIEIRLRICGLQT